MSSRTLFASLALLTACTPATVLDDAGPDATTVMRVPECAPRLIDDTSGVLLPTAPFDVMASGAVAYHLPVFIGSGPPETPVELDATLMAVDVATGTLHFGAPSLDVVITPADPTVLGAVPTGGAVHLHFEAGLTVTSSADGSLVLAALGAYAISADAGPVHIAQTTPACASVRCYLCGTSGGCSDGVAGMRVSFGGSTDVGIGTATRVSTPSGDLQVLVVATRQQIIGAQLEAQTHPGVGMCADAFPALTAVLLARAR